MTTHYEKIQALGNRMASNLETMGVSASFGDGGLTLADKILQIQHFTDGLLLWADKDIIQTGDTVNFCALLLEDKKAVSGETILFKGLETTQTLVANTETSVGNQYKFINLPTMTDFSQRVYLNEEQTIYITKGQQDINYYIWIPGTPSGYFVPIDDDSDIIVENGVIKLKSNHSDWTYDASATNTNKITSTISDVTIAETMQGTTGSNGVATVSYTGKGVGDIDVQADYNGIIQSERYDFYDCLWYDTATTDKTANYTKVNSTLTFQNNKLTITRNADGECYVELDTNGALTLSDYKGKKIKFECNVTESDANLQIGIFQYVGGWQVTRSSAKASGLFEVSADIDPNATLIRFRVIANNLGTGGSCSFNNIKLYSV